MKFSLWELVGILIHIIDEFAYNVVTICKILAYSSIGASASAGGSALGSVLGSSASATSSAFSSAEASPAVSALKVSKFQRQIFLFSFEPKNEWNYSLNSALAYKMSQIKKN